MAFSLIKDHYRKHTYLRQHRELFLHDKNKIRLCIVTGQLAAGGVERVLLSMVEGLPKEQFEIVIYVTDFSNNVWMEKFEKICNVVHVTKVLDWTTDESLISDYLSTSISYNKADVVFITNSSAGYRALPKIKRMSLFRWHKIRIYDLLHTHGTPKEKDAFLSISQPFDKYLTRRIVISHYLKKYLCEHYPINENRVFVIYNGLPAKTTRNHSELKQDGDKFLRIKQKQRAITFVGRLQSDKSPERLVELAALARPLLEQQSAFIAVVGDGDMRQSLEAKSKKLGLTDNVIRFYGFSDNPDSVISSSYFTLLTSNLEGIPMSVLESMDLSVPAIAPAVGGLPEIISKGTGLLVDFSSSQEKQKMLNLNRALKEALLLSDSSYSKMKIAAHKHIDKNFKHMEKDYISLFKSGEISN